jgi:SNF2 family DNA or RNA helicase
MFVVLNLKMKVSNYSKEVKAIYKTAEERLKKDVDGKDRGQHRMRGAYQVEGAHWLINREMGYDGTQRGGIFADDMGMGKTNMIIMTIKGNVGGGPTLIVTEISVQSQWKVTLEEFGGIRPYIASSSRTSLYKDDAVVLTTYSAFQAKGGLPAYLNNGRWFRVILDEAHKIRNPKTLLFKRISMINASIKWALTATPVQNSPKDLAALASWIGIPDNLKDAKDKYLMRRTVEAELAKNNRDLTMGVLDSKMVYLDFQYEFERDEYDNQVKSQLDSTRLDSTRLILTHFDSTQLNST